MVPVFAMVVLAAGPTPKHHPACIVCSCLLHLWAFVLCPFSFRCPAISFPFGRTSCHQSNQMAAHIMSPVPFSAFQLLCFLQLL